MAITHESSTATGKELCQSLFKLLSARIAGLESIRLKRGCAFVAPGQAKLCYIFHFKKLEKIQIWPYFDYHQVDNLKQFVGSIGLPVTPRNSIAGMAQLYPPPIELRTNEDIEKAVEVLQFAHTTKLETHGKRDRKPKKEAKYRESVDFETFAIELTESSTFPEGGRKTVIVNNYERSSSARRACLQIYGVSCTVCGMDFESRYGHLGKDFIHVHHVLPLSEIRRDYKVDPRKDLRPVCPNCHEMLHRRQPVFSIEELRALLRSV